MATDKIQIKIANGTSVDAMAPVIISASRSTDIPAFYPKWFFNCLKSGYCRWINPFNRAQKTYVSFKRCRAVVFWTKNPYPIMEFLPKLDDKHYYFQFTLNDYTAEFLEPNVPKLQERIDTFRRLSDKLGPDRVIWRFDPLIITPSTHTEELLRRIESIGHVLKGYTNKLVFSFLDLYGKTVRNMSSMSFLFPSVDDVRHAAPDSTQQRLLAKGIAELRDGWNSGGWPLVVATCGEKESFADMGIMHNRCIDGELMERLWPDDEELVYFLRTGKSRAEGITVSTTQGELFDSFQPTHQALSKMNINNIKDKGQRKECGCIPSKDIGSYNTCSHFCVYCYANYNKKIVQQNNAKHNDTAESIGQ